MVTADKVLSEPQLHKLLKKLRTERDKSLAILQGSTKRHPAEIRTKSHFQMDPLFE